MPAKSPYSPSERVLARCVRVGDCLIWTGAKNNKGYGLIGVGTKVVLVHRVVYEAKVGPIPSGHELDHVKARGCQSTACCDVGHLEPVTHRENMLRGNTFAAAAAKRTHCQKGHLLSGENVYLRKRGGRECRSCNRDRDQSRSPRG